MKRLPSSSSMLALLLPLLLAGCGIQPTEVITGTPATGAVVYLIQINSPVPVLRPSRTRLTRSETVNLLLAQPSAAEQEAGFSSEVPGDAGPIILDTSAIQLSIDPNLLSPMAVAQIACTAAFPVPIPLTGAGQTRGPVICPI